MPKFHPILEVFDIPAAFCSKSEQILLKKIAFLAENYETLSAEARLGARKPRNPQRHAVRVKIA